MQLVKWLGKDRHHRKGGAANWGRLAEGLTRIPALGTAGREKERDGAECLTVSPAPRLKEASKPASCPCRKAELQPTPCPTSLGGRSSTPVC